MTGSNSISLRSLGLPRRLSHVLGCVFASVIFAAGYIWLIGPSALWNALTSVSSWRFGFLLLISTIPLILWGGGFYVILRRLGHTGSFVVSVLLVNASGFLNTITPFGQLGGNPPAALLIKRALGTDFETALAGIGVMNATNRLASIFLGFLAASYLGWRLIIEHALNIAVFGIIAVIVATVLAAGLLWQYRYTLVDNGSQGLSAIIKPLNHLPRIDVPSRERLRQRGVQFIEALELLATAPAELALVFGLCMVGQAFIAAILWVALAALGTDLLFATVLLVIPVAKLGAIAPTPGGLGAAETLLAGTLMTTTEVTAAVAGAAAILYRASAFWIPALTGGFITAWYVLRKPTSQDG
ncbi:lysylphosphatidylglycerol synthase transmembrane domain-containing protein [Haloquadratum walsbyi]|uniref:Putative integral membrane protein n=1 Tax=Haloquadratum walsbyi J07HQW2 TaxID=1238425 RepID=U1PXK8_9EURY|nr:lysylphosphatidylglycerol synthase transmembrane domain-containing protein [Haloquadratum walsbyi]ERG97201.1 MAG: putative integral membrane protein [Haloquadratum walsbyi J07HQW2]